MLVEVVFLNAGPQGGARGFQMAPQGFLDNELERDIDKTASHRSETLVFWIKKSVFCCILLLPGP